MQKNICVRPLTDIHGHVRGHFLTRMHYARRLECTDESASNRAQGLFFKLVVLSAVPFNAIPSASWPCLLALIGPYRLIDHQLRRAGDPWHRPGVCQKVGRLRKGPGKGHHKLSWLLWWVLSVFTMKAHPCGDEDSEWSALMAEYIDTYCNLIEFILLLNIFIQSSWFDFLELP